MSLSQACCTLPPISSDYEPKGTLNLKLGDLKVYESAENLKPKVLLICCYDIFGVHPNTQQFCDNLASSGVFRVAMPDFFRGNPLKAEFFRE